MVIKTKYSIINSPLEYENVNNLQFVHFSKEAFNDLPDLDKLEIKDVMAERVYDEDPDYVVISFSRRNLFKFMDFMTREKFWA